jgi:hypothetical protein
MSKAVSIGSRVRFLNETGEGIVSGFTSEGKALVRMDDGFEIPYLANKLVVVGETEPQEENATVGQQPVFGSSLNESLFLAIVLEGYKAEEPQLSVRLVNLRKEKLFVTLYSQAEKQFRLETSLELNDTNSNRIFNCSLPELLKRDRFYFQVVPILKQATVIPGIWSGYVKYQLPLLASPELWPIEELFMQRALLIEVYPEPQLKQAIAQTVKHISHRLHVEQEEWLITTDKNGNFEVDLHIEELLDNTSGMDNSEIIRFQLRHFEKSIDEARRRRIKKFVAIHGIGKGRLKEEIRKVLTVEKLEHYDASYQRYGGGATEIVVR